MDIRPGEFPVRMRMGGLRCTHWTQPIGVGSIVRCFFCANQNVARYPNRFPTRVDFPTPTVVILCVCTSTCTVVARKNAREICTA